MARKKPISGKQKALQLQESRARKAANKVPVPYPDELPLSSSSPSPSTFLPTPSSSSRPLVPKPIKTPRQRWALQTPEELQRTSRREQQMKLESRFLKLPLDLIQHHRLISANEVLGRPIEDEVGVLRKEELFPEGLREELTVPKRPKWSYHSTKKEVEKNEEGMFSKWLYKTDQALATYSASTSTSVPKTITNTGMAPSPSFFERNLQVWRQLWRVTEVSNILLILIDVRFPLLHYPPSLSTYLKSLRPKKKLILVLTKTDLVPKWVSESWKVWFEENECRSNGGEEGDGGVSSVVMMESYKESEKTFLTQGTQPRFLPSASPTSRHSLLTALRKAHSELLVPPKVVSDYPERLAKWSPRVKTDVDWDSVERDPEEIKREEKEKKRKSRRGRGKGREVQEEREEVEEDEEEETPLEQVGEEENGEGLKEDEAYPFLSVGMIGQPNVGKSSLLNALLERKVVRASRTPGKTKTLQTIFWNSTLRLVDCPGLVFPSASGMERQVLAGILPIQNVELVVYWLAQRMPLEKILGLKKSEEDEFDLKEDDGGERWTSDEILSSYALSQGFITAKAGRPDLYRAGAFLLRQIHSNTIPWAFRPPFEGDSTRQDQEGIFLPNFKPKASSDSRRKREEMLLKDVEESGSGSGSGSSEVESESEEPSEEEDGSEEEEEDDSANVKAVAAIRGAFAALDVEGTDESEETTSEEEAGPHE